MPNRHSTQKSSTAMGNYQGYINLVTWRGEGGSKNREEIAKLLFRCVSQPSKQKIGTIMKLTDLPESVMLDSLAQLPPLEVDALRFLSRAHNTMVDKYEAMLPKHSVTFHTDTDDLMSADGETRKDIVGWFTSKCSDRSIAITKEELSSMLESKRLGCIAELHLSPWGSVSKYHPTGTTPREQVFLGVFREKFRSCGVAEHFVCHLPLNGIHHQTEEEMDFLPFFAQHGASKSMVFQLNRLPEDDHLEDFLEQDFMDDDYEPTVLCGLIEDIVDAVTFHGLYANNDAEALAFPKEGFMMLYTRVGFKETRDVWQDALADQEWYIQAQVRDNSGLQQLNDNWEEVLYEPEEEFHYISKWAGGNFPHIDTTMLDKCYWKVWRVMMSDDEEGPYLRVMQKVEGNEDVSVAAHFRVFEKREDEEEFGQDEPEEDEEELENDE